MYTIFTYKNIKKLYVYLFSEEYIFVAQTTKIYYLVFFILLFSNANFLLIDLNIDITVYIVNIDIAM